MWKWLANTILKFRFIVLGAMTLITVYLGFKAFSGLQLENKYGIMLPKDSEATRIYKDFKKAFGEDGGTLVIAVQSDSLYSPRLFRKWKELGDSILKIDGVEREPLSEAHLFSLENNREKSSFEIHRIFDPKENNVSSEYIDSIKRVIRLNPLYKGLLYNDSSNVSLMLVSIDERYLMDKKKSAVVLEIEELAQTYEPYFGKIRFAGLPHLRVIIAKRIQNEMYFFISLSLIVTALLIYFFFRSFKAVIICLIVVAVAVIWALGSMAVMGFSLSILTALIPPLMIVIGVPNCIYLITKYHQEIKEHGNKIKGLVRVIQNIGIASFMTNFTTAVGFLTFCFTNSEKLFEFGLTAGLNVMGVFVISLTLLPIFNSLVKVPRERQLRHLDRKLASGLISSLEFMILKKRRWIYVSVVAVIGLGIWGLSTIETAGQLTGDLPKDDQIVSDLKFLEANFGGSIPFEIMINYKQPGRLWKKSTLERVETIQNNIETDTLFSKSISIVNFLKFINMVYYGNDPDRYELIAKRDMLRLKKYRDNFQLANSNGGFSEKELVDTANTTLRVRCQMKDIGSYEQAEVTARVHGMIDSIMNPDKRRIEFLYSKTETKLKPYTDSLLSEFPVLYNAVAEVIANGNEDLQFKFNNDPETLKKYIGQQGFRQKLRTAIDNEYFDVKITGTSVIASEGTRYLVNNLFSSIVFAIICISLLMAMLFRSWRMVAVAMIPNIVPLLFTAGIMGFLGIPLKPSTLLIFSIALGIAVDDTIHYLVKYRMELKARKWDLKQCVIIAVRESGLGMFYTSIVLCAGFSVFMFSQFGGTQALGLLIGITLFVAMITNLLVLPSLLLSLERRLVTKSFIEPYFEAYSSESEIDWNLLSLEDNSSASTEKVSDESASVEKSSDENPLDETAPDENNSDEKDPTP